MSDAAYSGWLEGQIGGSPVDWLSDTIKVVLVSSAYTFADGAKHYSDLVGILGEATLTGKTCTGGVLDAADAIVPGPVSGTPHAAIVLKWTGTGSTSPLMLYLDEGVGFQPWGGDINVIWPDDAGVKIFPLGGGPA